MFVFVCANDIVLSALVISMRMYVLVTVGLLFVRGFGTYGVLGSGGTAPVSTPPSTSAITSVAQVGAGDYNTCVVTVSGACL